MNKLAWFALSMTLFGLAGCGDDDGGGGGSLTSRCEDWCDRRNDDDDCGVDVNCPATCSALVTNADAMGCTTEADALFDCFEAADEICTAGGAQACGEENTALVACENPPPGDGGA
jgi:hypothetical protein